MEIINQYKAVQEQYKTEDNLNTRISIHYNISDNNKILELGCGTGDMWKTKLLLLNESIKLTLTELSEKMVSVAKNTLGEQNHILYNVVNIENIPYMNNYLTG